MFSPPYRQLPVPSSNFQLCQAQVSTPSFTSPRTSA